MTSGEITAIVSIVSMVFSFLGVSGIDSGVISQAVTGFISFVGIVAAVWTYYKHKNAVAATPPQA